MMFFSIALLLSASLAFAFAAPAPENKEQVALRECNITNPVQRNPRIVISSFIIKGGELLNLTHEEKCFLNCHLQKINFLDENSNIRSTALLNNTLTSIPELANYTNVLIGHIYQLNRIYKGVEDKCEKAFVHYYEYTNQVIALSFASLLSKDTQAQIAHAVENNKKIDSKLLEGNEKTLDSFSEELKRLIPLLEDTNSVIN